MKIIKAALLTALAILMVFLVLGKEIPHLISSKKSDSILQELPKDLSEIMVEGLITQEKLNNLAIFLNERNEDYKVAYGYRTDPITNKITVVVDVVFYSDAEMSIKTMEQLLAVREAVAKINKTLGEIAIATGRINPWDILIIRIDFISQNPSGALTGYYINHENLLKLQQEKDPTKWSLYSDMPLTGTEVFPNIGPICESGKEEITIIPNE